MDSLKLTFFGSPQVELNGVPIQFRTRKALALLVYLAVNQQSQSRETLAALFWPEFSSDRAFANLREALRLLKQHLSDHWLEVRRQGVTVKMDSTLRIDVFEFQRHLDQTTDHAHSSNIACADCLPALLAAIDLYRDDFLRGFTLPDSPGFDEWQSLQIDLLRKKMIGSLKKVIRYYASHNDFPQAIDHARHWVARSPWSEAAHRELIRLYALNHQRSAALQQYQECVRMLREEFEAEPDEETQGLYETILTKKQYRVDSMARDIPDDGLLREPTLHNLPAQTTTFIGRETEIAAVKNLLSQPNVRLLTLTGAGGSGKTRLGLQVAVDLLEDFRDGVFFVSLAPISDPDLMPSTVVRTLGLYVAGNTPPFNVLKTYLQSKQMLLLLDNFEQIIEAATMLVDLLSTAPDTKIVVTSRTVLRVSGEHEYLVPPLDVPDPKKCPTFQNLTRSEAVQLFAERANAVNMEFTLTEENAGAVGEICTRLDGLPLAIELAAARVRILSPQQMVARLGSPLHFLTGGIRGLPDRQQTLRNTIVWSYDLLDEEEKILFRRLAVFVGGCTLEAVEAICAIDDDLNVLTDLEALIDHNLLTHHETKGEPRFVMLETIREYALERFTESDEAESIRKRHTQFFIEFAEEANTHLNKTPIKDHVLWKERLTLDLENLRAALSWAIANAEERRQTAVHLHETLGDLLELTGQHEEARKVYLQTLREVPEHDVIWRSRLYRRIGKSWEVQSRHEKVLDAYNTAESTLEHHPNESETDWWQEWLEVRLDRALLYYWQNKLSEMTDLMEEIRPTINQYGTATQRTTFFNNLALLGYRREHYLLSEDTVSYSLAALSACHESNNLGIISWTHFLLGFSYLWANRLDEAEQPLLAALTMTEQTGDVVLQSRCLTYLTILYRRRGQIDDVRGNIPTCITVAETAQMPEYVGTANANRAWVAWVEENLTEAHKYGRIALELWQQVPTGHASCAFQWTALWPLLGIALTQGEIASAVEYAEALLDPRQKRLPDALTAGLEHAIQTWKTYDKDIVRNQLTHVIELAQELRHF